MGGVPDAVSPEYLTPHAPILTVEPSANLYCFFSRFAAAPISGPIELDPGGWTGIVT